VENIQSKLRFSGPFVPLFGSSTCPIVEYKVFLFDEPLKGPKSLKMFKISLTFRFDKLSNLLKSIQRRKFSDSDSVEQKNLIYGEVW
jgi:hypothetical protein